MTEEDYLKFERLLFKYGHLSVSYATEYREWRKTHGPKEPKSELLNTKGDKLDECGKTLRNFVKGFVNA